jgi:fumarate reductase subunit D
MPSRPSARLERRLLQGTVTVTALIPILVGVAGIVAGLGAFDASDGASRNADSHVRYLSGLSLAIGVAFWSTVPAIEASGSRFRLLTGLVVVGGLARLYAAVRTGLPGPAMRAGLALELLAAPLLALWRERLERRLSRDG